MNCNIVDALYHVTQAMTELDETAEVESPTLDEAYELLVKVRIMLNRELKQPTQKDENA